MSVDSVIKFGVGNVTFGPAAINPDWIIEGEPVTRNSLVSSSADGNSSTWMWDCTAGKFNWFYDIDETVYLIEGSVIIKDRNGETCHLNAGDTIFFPAGSSAEWTVPSYVRKVAFLRAPLSRHLLVARHIYRSLKRLVGRGKSNGENRAPATFQSR